VKVPFFFFGEQSKDFDSPLLLDRGDSMEFVPTIFFFFSFGASTRGTLFSSLFVFFFSGPWCARG